MTVQSADYRYQLQNSSSLKNTRKSGVHHVSISGLDKVIDPPFSFGDHPDSGPTLAVCNDKLMAYIDKARVLAEAKDLHGCLPQTLKEKSTMSVEFGDSFKIENEKLRKMIKDVQEKLRTRRELLERLKKENKSQQEIQFSLHKSLVEKRSTLNNLELEEANLGGKIKAEESYRTSILDQIKMSDIDIQALKNRHKAVSTRMTDMDVPDVPESFSLKEKLGAEFESKRSREEQRIIIKISNRYLEKMKEKLSKYRLMYQERYKQLIERIEKDGEEIMNLYTEVGEYIQMEAEGKIKKDFASNKNKNYEARIKSLSQDIAELRTRIKTLESNFDVSAAQYKRQLAQCEEDSAAIRGKLSELLTMFTEYARWKYSTQGEMAIYGELLVQEQDRVRDNKVRDSKIHVHVSESTSKRSVSSQMRFDSSRKSSRKSRRDSGFFSPEPRMEDQISSNSNFLQSLEADVTDGRKGKNVSRVYMGYSM